MDLILAVVVFGVLLAISLYGLRSSLQASKEVGRGRPAERPMAGVSPNS
jgi:hypothetical protein